MDSSKPECPSCGSRRNIAHGVLPFVNTFAGNHLPEPIGGGQLIECKVCCLSFRYPVRDYSSLIAQYTAASGSDWDPKHIKRPDHDVCEGFARSLQSNGKLLDIGCHTGNFLRRFLDSHELYGIEPMPDAQRQAQKLGVKIIGSHYLELQNCIEKFDVITAIDVVEHVPNPAEFVAIANRSLNKGGVLILATGNSQNIVWRLFGANYWYCGYAEHISFICPSWARFIAVREDMRLIHLQNFRWHGPIGPREILIDVFSFASYFFFKKLWRHLRRKQNLEPNVPPPWRLAADHMVVAFKKA